jgi:desulfoferrodoxin (superoxide reductase-like protein)
MRLVFVFLVFCFLSVFLAPAYAHPPQDISITYHPSTKILVAVIVHNVNDPKKHYIKKVDIGLNGKEIIQQEISIQDNNSTQTVTYMVPEAKAGDRVSVEAYCSISGKLEKEIKITDK